MNNIRKHERSVEVTLDAGFLITEKLHVPAGKQPMRLHTTFGQMVETIAMAHLMDKKPEWGAFTRMAKVSFANGAYIVVFANGLDDFPTSESIG